MRTVALWLVAVLGLLVVLVAALWLLLPWLVGPSSQPAPLGAAQASPLRILTSARAGAGGSESLTLGTSQADALLAAATRSTATTGLSLSALRVSFAQGELTLSAWGNLPASVPLRRLAGRPFEAQMRLAPRLVGQGVVSVTLTALRLGRVGVTGLVPAATVLHLLLPHKLPAWVRVKGATLTLDLGQAPPIAIAPLFLHLLPTSLSLAPGTLAVTIRPQASLLLDPTTLDQTLAQAFAAQGVGVTPHLQFYPGSAEVTLIGGSAGNLTVQHIGLTASVVQTGVLQIDTTGVSPQGAAALLIQAAGDVPPWLTVGAQGLQVNFERMQAFSVGSGVHLRLLPTSAALTPQGFEAQLEVIP